ncbi:hypothetical protein APR12_000148 [Nocardia amikacinitolerans]|uniref:hypothetical protein n=1 Tax=Nocardia amikacinitolerans TaxID=756689 RepID=UPI00082A94D6|nr:hypothetical protein [Nocardia amikacinitolerans]MCP2314818.1 hypothetical protein [Nocardia amikacinitolerans]
MSLSPNIRKALITLAVSGALVTSTGLATAHAAPAPAPAAPAAVADSGSASGSATYGRDFVEFIVCLLKGQFMGSKYPLC